MDAMLDRDTGERKERDKAQLSGIQNIMNMIYEYAMFYHTKKLFKTSSSKKKPVLHCLCP